METPTPPAMPDFTKDVSALHSMPTDQPSDQAPTKQDETNPQSDQAPPTLTPDTKVGDGGMPMGLESLRNAFRVTQDPDFMRRDLRNVENRLIFTGKSLEESFTEMNEPFPKIAKQIEAAGGKVLIALHMDQTHAMDALRGITMIRRMMEVLTTLKPASPAMLPVGIIFALFPFGMSFIVVKKEDV
jgi:hypothetical protein